MGNYVTVTTEVDVEIDLSDISDEVIRDQYYERNLGGGADDWDELAELNKAYLAHHNKDRDKAYEILWEMCLSKLNKVV